MEKQKIIENKKIREYIRLIKDDQKEINDIKRLSIENLEVLMRWASWIHKDANILLNLKLNSQKDGGKS